MGWKGTVRSIAAAARAAERDAQRRHRAALKQEMIDDAEDAVASWEEYVENLISVHIDLADAISWQEISETPKPEEPCPSNIHERLARQKLGEFKPGFLDFLVGGSEKKRKNLEDKLALAPTADKDDFMNRMKEFRKALTEWDNDTALARKVIAGEQTALLEVIREFQNFEKEALIGSAVSFEVEENFVHAMPEVHSDNIVPNYRRKQLASGKLSETKMPVGQFNELYQDYVCSVALKVAGDLFHILPLNEVYVTCKTIMLNAKTGHQELTPILSVKFVRDSFMRLNLSNIDPSDSMENFNHVMSFKKTKGFAAVEPLRSTSHGDNY